MTEPNHDAGRNDRAEAGGPAGAIRSSLAEAGGDPGAADLAEAGRGSEPAGRAEAGGSSGQVPRRELGDPKVLRALSHPVRLQIMDALLTYGPATATELSERVGESAANCSWHLRQLAQHGFVEEAGGGTGRRRPWKLVVQSTTIARPDEEEPEFATARDILVEVLIGREIEAWRTWHATRHGEPPEWRDAAFGSQSNGIWLTAEELAAYKSDINAAVDRHLMSRLDRIDPANRPVGSRPTRSVAWGIPSGPPHAGEPEPEQ